MTNREEIEKALADMDVRTRYWMIKKMRREIFIHPGSVQRRRNKIRKSFRATLATHNNKASGDSDARTIE